MILKHHGQKSDKIKLKDHRRFVETTSPENLNKGIKKLPESLPTSEVISWLQANIFQRKNVLLIVLCTCTMQFISPTIVCNMQCSNKKQIHTDTGNIMFMWQCKPTSTWNKSMHTYGCQLCNELDPETWKARPERQTVGFLGRGQLDPSPPAMGSRGVL